VIVVGVVVVSVVGVVVLSPEKKKKKRRVVAFTEWYCRLLVAVLLGCKGVVESGVRHCSLELVRNLIWATYGFKSLWVM